jgi:iron complex outermembrane receptor protein
MLKALILQTRLIALACSMSLVGLAMADEAKLLNIPPGDLVTALETLARQSGAELVYQASQLAGIKTNGVSGVLSPHDAVSRLLVGTKLKVSADAGGAMLISAPSPGERSADFVPGSGAASTSTRENTSSNRSVGSNRRNPIDDTAQVLVTAQKREELLQDVPMAVTAISTESLVDTNQLRGQDYYATVPGLTVVPVAGGTFQSLSIRGIAAGNYAGNPLIGITVDDVPLGSSTLVGGGGGRELPDIDPGELTRVEILRGPQGTLYGASSMSGLLKFVTVDPSTDGVSGRVQGDIDSVYNGSELGYGVRGSINTPIDNDLAIRVSGFTRRDPGYIDNPILHINGVNEQRVSGGRLSALWKPNGKFSLKLSALMQDANGPGTSDVHILPGLGDLQQNYLRGSGAHDRRFYACSAIVKTALGSVDLTSVSGYNVTSFSDSTDDTWLLGTISQELFGVSGATYTEHNRITKFNQEIRVSAPMGRTLDWLFGGFYTHENSHGEFHYLANDIATGAAVGNNLFQSDWSAYQEYAAFGDLAFHLTDRVTIQVGARISHIGQSLRENDIGPLVPSFDGVPSPFVGPNQEVSSNPSTYLVTPQFKVSPDLLIYTRFASGYRAGGINFLGSSTGVIPPIYRPDTTRDYEFGVKGEFLEHTLSIDASLFYIDWNNFQILFLVPENAAAGFVGNGSKARSQGAELSVESQPLTGLKLAAWAAWGDAVLTRELPPASSGNGLPGDRLPYSSRYSGNLSLEQTFRIVNGVTAFFGGILTYVGMREGEFVSAFASSTQRQVLPAYTKFDLRAGAQYESWTVNLFADNVTDKRGVIAGGVGSYPPFGFIYIRPRTVGLSVVKTF